MSIDYTISLRAKEAVAEEIIRLVKKIIQYSSQIGTSCIMS